MGVAAEIVDGIAISVEGLFGVGDPVGPVEPVHKTLPVHRNCRIVKGRRQHELAGLTIRFQGSHEFAAKHLRGCSDRDEETAAAFAKLQITGKTGAGDDAVHMGMEGKVLSPRVQHQDDTRRSAKISFVAGQRQKRLGGSLHEQRIQEFLVGQKQRIQIMGHGEYEVEVLRIEHFAAALIDPKLLQDGLTVRAVAIAAGRIVDFDMTAFITNAGVDAEAAGLAVRDGIGRPQLFCRDRVYLQIIRKRFPEDITDGIGLRHRTPRETGWDWDTSSDFHRRGSHR